MNRLSITRKIITLFLSSIVVRTEAFSKLNSVSEQFPVVESFPKTCQTLEASSSSRRRRTTTVTTKTKRKPSDFIINRRNVFHSFAFVSSATLIIPSKDSSNTVANAAVEITKTTSKISESTTETIVESSGFTSNQIINFLQVIPTFTIVDPSGTPYMVVGEDAKPTAYFFTTYNEAERILKVANDSAIQTMKDLKQKSEDERKANGIKEKRLTKEEEEAVVGVNPWSSTNARISTVPLSLAVTLASKGKIKGAFFRISPAQTDVQDALLVNKSSDDDLPEGKVPLFYFEDFEISVPLLEKKVEQEEQDRTKIIPLYFSKKQLEKEFRKMNAVNKEKKYPSVKVTELFSLLSSMVESKNSTREEIKDLEKLMLIPPDDSIMKAKSCLKKGGNNEPFKFGERIIVL